MLFYVLTGWYQTYYPHRNKTPGEAQDLVERLVSVHVDQLYPSPAAEGYSPKKFQLLVAVMSAALLVTTVIGLALAFQLTKKPWPVLLCLVFGVVVPVILLWMGQKRV